MIEGRFQSLNVCLDVWSKRGASEEPKVAGICGASEIRIDASTAAAVIIRASLFMILTRGVFVSEIAVLLCGCRCNLDDFHPTTAGYFGLSRRAQGPLFCFPAPNQGIFLCASPPSTRGKTELRLETRSTPFLVLPRRYC
jgi:hypothetical protein